MQDHLKSDMPVWCARSGNIDGRPGPDGSRQRERPMSGSPEATEGLEVQLRPRSAYRNARAAATF